MELALTVTHPGREPEDLVVDLGIPDLETAGRIAEHAGMEAVVRHSGGRWEPEVVKAIVYEALAGRTDRFDFDSFDLDLGELTQYLVGRDPDMEADLPMASA